jgi:hypothetical protein
MKRSWQNSLVVLGAIALLSGAVWGHYASGSRAGGGSTLSPADQSSVTAVETKSDGSSGGDSHSVASTGVSPRNGGADATVGDRRTESFHEWFQKYRAANPDMRRLRGELEAALAQLPPDEGASDAAAALESIRRAEQTAGDDYASLVDQAAQFLETYPNSPLADEVREMFAKYSRAWDEHAFEIAREFSHSNPDRFESRILHYEQYLERHGVAGQHTADAKLALESIRSEWAEHDYQGIQQFYKGYPNDLRTVATRVRRFVDDHPSHHLRRAADQFLARYDRSAAPGEYRVRVVSGSFARTIGHALSFGPDLAVEVEVAGIRIGRTPIVPDSFEPVWNYEFPQTIRWRLGDPVKIRVIDFDYSNRAILKVETADDPLAMRFLSGTWEAQGHRLTFECNFEMPSLPALPD